MPCLEYSSWILKRSPVFEHRGVLVSDELEKLCQQPPVWDWVQGDFIHVKKREEIEKERQRDRDGKEGGEGREGRVDGKAEKELHTYLAHPEHTRANFCLI